jgi:5'-3' exonuclease
MGIQDFYDLIKQNCPEILVSVDLSTLAGQRVAVDISIFLNKYVKTAGAERWIDTFIILMCVLKKHGIKPVNIFDGPNPPQEKKKEQNRRRAEAAKLKERIAYGRSIVKRLEDEYAPDDRALEPDLIGEVKDLIGARATGRAKAPVRVNYDDVYDVIASLKEVLAKKEKQNLPILPEYSAKAKEIIEIMGFPHFQAPGEAETLCAGLCCAGLVDAVLSEDTDVMAYGTPFLLSKLDITTETVTVVSHEAILHALGFTHFQFRDLCILLSCDYNSRIKGYVPDGKKRKKPAAIGVKGAFIMMQEYETLEEAEKYMEDSDPLNYRRCRDLFTPPSEEELSGITIPYNNPIDKDRLFDFIAVNKVRVTLDYILESWTPVELEFVSAEGSEVEEGDDVSEDE